MSLLSQRGHGPTYSRRFPIVLVHVHVEEVRSRSCDTLGSSGEAGLPWKHCRLMVLGSGGVGKSSCINSLCGKPFQKDHESTIGADIQTLQLERMEAERRAREEAAKDIVMGT